MNMDWDSQASSQKHLWTQGSSAIALLDTERPVHAAWPPVPNNTGRKSHYVSKPGASNGHMNGGAHAITSHWKLTSCDSRALVQNTHCNERHSADKVNFPGYSAGTILCLIKFPLVPSLRLAKSLQRRFLYWALGVYYYCMEGDTPR